MHNADIFMIYFVNLHILFVSMRKEKQCLKDMHSVL